MTKSKLKDIISECCNDVVFSYNGKASGVTSEVYNSIPVFQAWHGDKVKEYSQIDVLMEDKFFSGRSLSDLVSTTDFTLR